MEWSVEFQLTVGKSNLTRLVADDGELQSGTWMGERDMSDA